MHLIAQATQPTETMPGWGVATLSALGALVAILAFINVMLWPQVKSLIGKVSDAVAEARAAREQANAATIKAAVAHVTANKVEERVARNAARTDTLMLNAPPPGQTPPPSAMLLLPLLLLLFVGGCLTSEGYKTGVAASYPVIAARMEGFSLTPVGKAHAQALRDVSADRKLVRYETAKPAWDNAGPEYRALVTADVTIGEQRRTDWSATADKIDRLQAAEDRYRRTLGIASPPLETP